MTPMDGNWIHLPSMVDFLRFENLDDDPEVSELKITLLTAGKSLRFPIPGDPHGNPLIQEPTLNKLPAGRQPVRFSAPLAWIDCDNAVVNQRCDLAMYSSFEYVGGKSVLFYPDRKHFLVGKLIDRERLAKAVFP